MEVQFALKHQDEIVAQDPRTKRIFDLCGGVELSTLGAKHARPDVSKVSADYMASRSPDEVKEQAAAHATTSETKRHNIVELCNFLEVPGADKDSPNEFQPWCVREWHNGADHSAGMTFGSACHARRSGISRKQVLTKLGAQMDARPLSKITPEMKEKYEHALKLRPSKPRVDRKYKQSKSSSTNRL